MVGSALRATMVLFVKDAVDGSSQGLDFIITAVSSPCLAWQESKSVSRQTQGIVRMWAGSKERLNRVLVALLFGQRRLQISVS